MKAEVVLSIIFGVLYVVAVLVSLFTKEEIIVTSDSIIKK